MSLIYEFMANGDLKEHLSGMVFIQNQCFNIVVFSFMILIYIVSKI